MIAEDSFGQRLAIAVLEWLDASGKLTSSTDLCLIETVPGLEAELPSEVRIAGGRQWALARVDGDLALRCVLVESAGLPVVAFSDKREDAFQADLRERAILRRVIRPLARHLLAAAAKREASSVDEERFDKAVLDVLKRGPAKLEEAALRRTWTGGIRDQDAAAILCDAAFGFDDRQSSLTAYELWAKWILDPPSATEPLIHLAVEVLQRRYPGQGPALVQVLRSGARERLVEVARKGAGDLPADELAVDTARHLLEARPDVLAHVLEPAETAYVRSGAPKDGSRLLRQAFLSRRRALIRQCGSDAPPAQVELERIRDYVYASRGEATLLGYLARLARGLLSLETRDLPSSVGAYGDAWLSELAWLDRAARRVRTAGLADPEYMAVGDTLVNRWYGLRDRWNAGFAALLVKSFGRLFASPGEEGPYVVSQLMKYVVAPSLAKTKTFLVVLDGCDVPTFLELLEAFAAAGVAPIEPVRVALSAIPTMTGHARRAIFGGAIPGDGLSQDDDSPADAAGDHKALANEKHILKAYRRRLFLKGELADSGAALVEALKDGGEHELVAAVFNDIDDALASKERTTLAERTLGSASRAVRDAMAAAVDGEWQIIVTADHGNTPYREPDPVIRGLGGARFVELQEGASAPQGTVVFEKGVGLPYRIAALHQLGAHGGPQHVGYHGGVSIEEMFVPLAVLGPPRLQSEGVQPPSWWSGPAAFLPVREAIPPPAQPTTGYREVLARCRAELEMNGHDAKNVEILEAIAEAGVLTAPQLTNKVALKGGRIRLRVTGIIAKLRSAGIAPPIEIDDEPEAFRWIGPA